MSSDARRAQLLEHESAFESWQPESQTSGPGVVDRQRQASRSETLCALLPSAANSKLHKDLNRRNGRIECIEGELFRSETKPAIIGVKMFDSTIDVQVLKKAPRIVIVHIIH